MSSAHPISSNTKDVAGQIHAVSVFSLSEWPFPWHQSCSCFRSRVTGFPCLVFNQLDKVLHIWAFKLGI